MTSSCLREEMTHVIKKVGRNSQPFIPRKLKRSIRKAAKDAGFSASEAEGITEKITEPIIANVKEMKEIKVADLKRMILIRLQKESPAVAKTWKRFEEQKIKNKTPSGQILEFQNWLFDRLKNEKTQKIGAR